MRKHLVVVALSTFLTLLVSTWPAVCQENLPKLVKKIQPAVVTVIAYDASGRVKGQGSGFFINESRDFITNYHVLAVASRAEVKILGGHRYRIKTIVAEDRAGDLIVAAIEIPVVASTPQKSIDDMTPEELAQVAGVKLKPPFLKISGVMPEVGERVAVVGSPLGLEQTLSDGVVSAVRQIKGLGEILQITAPISPGSSGSPVVNMKGEVIGVATLQIVKGQNLNFAVPGYRIRALKKRAAKPDAGQKLDYSKMSDAELQARANGTWKGPAARARGVVPPQVAEKKTGAPAKPLDGPADRFFKQALKFYESGNYKAALEACKKAIELGTDNPNPYLMIGGIYSKIGSHKRALEVFTQAVRNYPDNTMAHVGLGMAYYDLGRYQESADAYKQAIRLNPDLAMAHEGLGGSYLQLGYLKEGLAVLKQAKQMEPNNSDIHLKIGITYLALGNKGLALEEYKILQALDKKKANELFNLIYR